MMTSLTNDLRLAEAIVAEGERALAADLVEASSEQFDTGLSVLILRAMGQRVGLDLDLELERARSLATDK